MRREFGPKHADMERVVDSGRYGTGRHVLKEFLAPKLTRKCGQLLGVNRNGDSLRDERFFFTFVRHPLHWYESWFRYMTMRGWHDWGDTRHPAQWHPNSALNGLRSDSIDEFISKVIDTQPGYVTSLFQRYTQDQIDFVGRQEYLADDLIRVLDMLDVKYDADRIRSLSPVNTSRPVETDMDEQLKNRLYRLEYAAVVRFGYDVEDPAWVL